MMHNILNQPVFMTGILLLSVSVSPTQAGQDSNPSTESVPGIVFRVSGALIDELTKDEIKAEIPFAASILKSKASGTALGQATLSIEMLESDDTAAFIITAKGTATGCFDACRGKLRVDGGLAADFTVRKTVLFDGYRYHNDVTESEIALGTTINQVDSQRVFPIRLATQPLASTGVKVLHHEAEELAIPYAKQYLEEFVETEALEVIRELNETLPFEESLHKIYPDTKEWIYRLSADDQYLQSYFGPKNTPVPTLPGNAELTKDSGLEIWIQADPKEAILLKRLAEWNKHQNVLEKFFPDTDPLIKSIIKAATIQTSGPWLIISVPTSELMKLNWDQ